MFVLQVEHEVNEFESWKKAFDASPKSRTALGISQYEVFCLSNNPNYVIINFWFDEIDQAEHSRALLHNLWDTDASGHLKNSQTRIFDMIDWSFSD